MAYIGNSPVQDETVTSAQIVDGAIVDADINSSAAIAFSKMANLTASRLLVSDGSGDVSVSNVTSAEALLLDGGTARGTTAVASGDGILINDGGTMRITNVDTVSTYFASHNVGGGNIVTTGTIGTGVWQGTAIASAYLDADTAHLSGSQTFSGEKTFSSNIIMADDTSIGIADDAERIEFDGAGDISVLGANFGIGTTAPSDYEAGADNLVLYEASNVGMTIASGTSGTGSIYFADGTSGDSEYRLSLIHISEPTRPY